MNEKQTSAQDKLRPTKKQKELLGYIEEFIGQHGYSPSYREIMRGLNYTSVATVALHVNSLIKRGHLQKREHSARSLEVTEGSAAVAGGLGPAQITSNQIKPSEERWLIEKVEHFMKQAEAAPAAEAQATLEQLQILLAALKVLGLDGAAQSFGPRLGGLKKRLAGEE